MTNEELIQKIKEGQTELMHELWSQVEAFVNSQAYKFITFRQKDNCAATGVEQEDLYCIGYFALEPAIKAFDSEKGYAFLTYFSKYLMAEFYKEIKVFKTGGKWYNRQDTLARAESLDKEIFESKDGTSITLDDILPDENTEAEFESVIDESYNKQLRADLEEAISSLRPRDAQIIRDYYFNTLSVEAQAQKLGISQTRINDLRKQALQKLRNHKALTSYREQISGLAYKSSVRRFKETGMSSVEQMVIKLDDYERRLGLK